MTIDGDDEVTRSRVLVLSEGDYKRLLAELDEAPRVNPELLKALKRTKRRSRSW